MKKRKRKHGSQSNQDNRPKDKLDRDLDDTGSEGCIRKIIYIALLVNQVISKDEVDRIR